jgi:hypothetical protein
LWVTCSVVAQGRQKRTLATNGVMTRNYLHGNIILGRCTSYQTGEFRDQASSRVQDVERERENGSLAVSHYVVLKR